MRNQQRKYKFQERQKKQALDQRKHQIDERLQRERQSSQVNFKQDRTGDDRGRKYQCQGEEEMELD